MKYSLGDLVVDTGRQSVSRSGVVIALPKLSYDLLLALIRTAPNLVSLDELMRLVWPGLVVSPETVSKRVMLLRDALDEDPRAPRYIAGLRGRGYQIIAEVSEVAEGVDPAKGAHSPQIGALAPSIEEAYAPSDASAHVSDSPPDIESPPQKPKLLVRFPKTSLLALLLVILAGTSAEIYWKFHAGHAASAAISIDPADRSIAVLPFVDMSENKDQEYFSDGMAEEIIDLLVKVPELKVPARTSSFYFKGKATQIPEIARELGVANILEGSVRKSGSHLRVAAQLIRADNGYHLWSEIYDRQLDDIFKVQDEIAAAVVGALKLKLFAAPIANDRHTASPEAHDNYLIGRYLLSSSNWMLDHSAAQAFRRAVDLEPNYAPAWAGLAEATFAEGDDSNSVAEYSTMTQKALAAADKAITLGPDLAEGFAVRGYIRSWGQWDFQGAADDFRRALVLEPDNPYVLSKYSGSVLMPIGQLDESVAAVEKALKLDPLNADSWRRLGIQQFYRGDQRAAQEALQRSLEINPEQSITAAYLAFTYLLLREPSSALPMSQRATSEAFRLQGAALAEHDLGHAKVAQQQLDDLIAKYEVGAADQIAEVYAWRGDTSQAFEWLEKAYLQHDTALTMVKVDPLLRSLRPDPRYAALLEKMKLQDQRPLY